MNWFLSILIGLITAVIGAFAAGYVAERCVRWYRVSSFEGASGYFVVFLGLLGLFLGLIIGIVASRFITAGSGLEFLRGLGLAAGIVVGLGAVIMALCRLGADIAPKLDGNALEVALEIRCPEGFAPPTEPDKYGMFVEVLLIRGRRQPQTPVSATQFSERDGRRLLTTCVDLDTNSSNKYIRLYLNEQHNVTFPLPLRGNPRRSDMEWSRWVESGWNANQPEPAPEQKFNLRYRVQHAAPPPPQPTQAELEAQHAAAEEAQFASLREDAPLQEWLRYTTYGTPPHRLATAVAQIQARPNLAAELSQLIQSADTTVSTEALRSLAHFPQPPADLKETVAACGRNLAEKIREMNTTPVEQDPSYEAAAEISVRFSAWMVAIEALRAGAGGDFTPELHEILTLARVREDSHCMRVDVVRVASYYLHEWAGIAPLPSDPKPRG